MRAPIAVALAAGLALGAFGCDSPAPDAGVEIEAPDVSDCDAGDKKVNKTPDCGRIVNGKFVPWSWVKANKTKPPPGWTPASEPKSTPAGPTPTPSKKKAGR